MDNCTVCGALVPEAGNFLGKLLGTGVGAYFGITAKSTWGKIIGVTAPIIGGAIVDELVKPVCGNCKKS